MKYGWKKDKERRKVRNWAFRDDRNGKSHRSHDMCSMQSNYLSHIIIKVISSRRSSTLFTFSAGHPFHLINIIMSRHRAIRNMDLEGTCYTILSWYISIISYWTEELEEEDYDDEEYDMTPDEQGRIAQTHIVKSTSDPIHSTIRRCARPSIWSNWSSIYLWLRRQVRWGYCLEL